jgi:hypothetical protein
MLDELEHDMERLRAYRAEVPAPDGATVRAARDQLWHVIGEEQRPAGSARGPRPARQRLRRLQRRRRLVLAGGLATISVGVAGTLGLATPAAPVSALAAQLHRLARVAANQTPLGIPGPNQYLYTESQSSDVNGIDSGKGTCWLRQLEHRQSWISVDSGSAIQQSESQGQFTSPADRATCAAAGFTDPAIANSDWKQRFRPDTTASLVFPTTDWSSLSTDPATLLQQVHQIDGGADTPDELFANVGDMLRESDAPSAIRAALYNAAALIPGVKLIGSVTDPLGGSGIGIALEQTGKPVSELIFDPQTSELSAEETLGADGQPTGWSAYLRQSIVDSLPDYPMDNNPTDQGAPADTSPASAQTTQSPSSAQTPQAGSTQTTGTAVTTTSS